MQFVIHAYDGTDDEALNRRMEARPKYLAYIQTVKEKGRVICGGGMLAEDGRFVVLPT